MNINLEYYKVFYYVGKLKRITLAAEALSISQPAVSQALGQLEKALGTTLFIRTSKGVKFTAAGEMLYAYVKNGYETIQVGEHKLLQMMNLEAGEIKIGASDMTLQFYLLPYLEVFREKYPKIKITVTNGPTPETLRFLQEGKIDFGIVSSPVSEKYDMKITKVREIEDAFIAGSRYTELEGKVLHYSHLNELPVICLEKNTSTRKYIDTFLNEKGVSLEPEIELATSDIIVQFALRNLGIGCVVKDFAEKYIADGKLFQLEFKEKIPKRHFCIATDNKNPLSAAAEKFMELMV